jgi:hypothetical protein
MRHIVNLLLVAVLTGFVGQYLGWIAVPVVAIIVSLGARELRLRAWQVGVGAALTWTVMLAASARSSAFNGLIGALAGVFNLPVFGLVCIVLLLPFALGWSSATVAAAFLQERDR